MDRRKFLIGAGSLAAGGAAALGSGAFSSASATRSVEVNTVSDANAYVGIEGDSDYSVQNSGGTLSITFGNNGEGLGLNANANTEFTDLLTVTNQGTDNVLVWVNLNELNNLSGINQATAYLSMPNKVGGMDGGDGGPAEDQAPGTSGSTGSFGIILGPGKSADIALRIQTNSELGTFDSELGVYAAAEDSERFSSVVAEYDFSTYTPRK